MPLVVVFCLEVFCCFVVYCKYMLLVVPFYTSMNVLSLLCRASKEV